MPQLDVYDLEKTKVGSIEIDSSVFEAPVKNHLLHEVVKWQLAKKRAGTASTKTRGEVRGGGAKPWRQKHTGRARAGSNRSPIWRKGAIVFGPKPKDWSFSINKKEKKAALLGALSSKYSDGSLVALKEFNLDEIKTKKIAGFVKTFELQTALVVIDGENENLMKSSRNIPNIKVVQAGGLNVYDVLKYKTLVMTEDSIKKTQESLKVERS